jgi:Leucine-rich repeat (LRR) protein
MRNMFERFSKGLKRPCLAKLVLGFVVCSSPLLQTSGHAEVNPTDMANVEARIKGLGSSAKLTKRDGKVVEIVVSDASTLTNDDVALFSKLEDLEKLQILNFRALGSNDVTPLFGLKKLKSLALTNTVIDDKAVEGIVKAFPGLTELDLSSNANMSSQVLKPISELKGLQSLLLLQNRLNEIGTMRLSKLEDLRVLDLRGNMEAGNQTMLVLGKLPKLKALKHRSTAITDYGMEMLSASASLENLLMQDFAITDDSGPHLAKLSKLSQLEIFRCQGFGSTGVLALKGLPLQRLTLRDLPVVDDSAMAVLRELPRLKRLYIQEISGITDSGLKNLESQSTLETLDVWSVPQMTDATMEIVSRLPNLSELSIRSTGVTDKAADLILAMPKLVKLTFKENGSVTDAAIKKLSAKKWEKLDLGK